MIKRTMVMALAASLSFCSDAAWRNLDDAHWCSGPKLTEADLAGKVVLVDEWGVNCQPCIALLPRMEAVWNSFKSKKFVLIGSHRQGDQKDKIKDLAKAKNLTYPIYVAAGLSNEPASAGIPFLYVVNHRGRVVYSGRDERAATEAIVNALDEVDAPPTFLGSYVFDKKSPWKNLENQLVLGKNVTAVQKKLEKAVADAEKKSATDQQKSAAVEAKKLVRMITDGKEDFKNDIETMKTANPEEAYKIASLYVKSFPEEKELKAALPEMKKAAAEWKAEQKAKAKARAKDAK